MHLKELWFIFILMASVQAQEVVNLAEVATPSASYVSKNTHVAALNDGVDPSDSSDRNNGSYCNWPKRGTQWVQYDWPVAVSTNKIEVYWWNESEAIHVPVATRLFYWDGHDFVPVQTEATLGHEIDCYNGLRFDEITTTRLRLEMDAQEKFSTGILEWKVYDSGKSPGFPPQVQADVDRTVVLSGKTYLKGQIKALSNDTRIQWSKASGPGWVTFADANQIETTATFSELGDYVLRFTATHGDLRAHDTLNVQVIADPPAQNLRPVDTLSYQITSPLWKQRSRAILVHWIPHCIDKINDPNLKEGGIVNFIEAAKKLQGLPAARHQGASFANAWVFNTIESICLALMVDPQGDIEIVQAQAMMKQTLADWIPKVLAAQEPDGYLQTAITLSNRSRWNPQRRGDHEGYVAGYYLEAAVSHYLLTDGQDLRLYNSAKQLADCWATHIGSAPGQQEWFDGHQAMEMALVRFGRFVNTVEGVGKGDKYIQLAKFLLDCRKDDNPSRQAHIPVVCQYEAVGHAVRASYNYAGMSDIAMETHDSDYQSAVMSLYDNLINRKYYLTGGIGSGDTTEGFGPDYSLPHASYCESCSSCGLIFFEHKLNMAYHDARFADLYEETLYNALLGSLDLEGKKFYYQNPLTERRARYPWHGCPCCIGNIPRVLLRLPTWIYVRDDNGLYVNLFIGSKVTVPNLAGTQVEVIQATDYPWNGDVSMTVNPEIDTTFTLHIRVPNREVSDIYHNDPQANGILWIKVNGELIQPSVEKGYAAIHRTWKTDDTITLKLPMEVQKVRAIEQVESTRGQLALRYGPLIYNVEAVDQDLDKSIGLDAALTTQWQSDLLQGILAIKGQWADGSELTAIPYYARANRKKDSQGDQGQRQREIISKVWIDE